jgi:formylglycine-generating enzyme required for sulfatase activity
MMLKRRMLIASVMIAVVLVSLGSMMVRFRQTPVASAAERETARLDDEEVYIPAGEFLMGCASDIWSGCDGDSQPIHAVYLDAYYIDKTEVTVAEYQACVDAGVCTAPDYDAAAVEPATVSGADGPLDPYPITHMTWAYADTYCRWVGKRLPTEAEWEKAAHGPGWQVYPWGNEAPTCELVNFDNCEGRALPVGSYPEGASPYGVLDMAGNVREWVNDFYMKPYYSRSPYFNPQGPAEELTVGEHLLRGGSWKDDFGGITTWIRLDEAETHYIYKVGFRCARSADGGGTPVPTPIPTSTPTPTPYAARAIDGEGGAVWLARPDRLALVEMVPGALIRTAAITLTYSDAHVSTPLSGLDQAFYVEAGPEGARGNRLTAPAAVLVTFPNPSPLTSDSVRLYRLRAGAWVTDGITLTAQGANYLHAHIEHTGLYAILGSTNRLFLPMTMR